MPLSEDKISSRYRISSYGPRSVTVNETVYQQSLVLTADELHCPWPVNSLEDLSEETLAPVLDSQPVVVLLGTGDRQQFPESKLFALFGERGIGLEVMDTGALCRTFNILIAEDRAVTAAIILES
jgi:uncharacterized protein